MLRRYPYQILVRIQATSQHPTGQFDRCDSRAPTSGWMSTNRHIRQNMAATAGAEIEIDGAMVGYTPFTVAIVPGSHKISTKKGSFNDWSETVKVTSGTVRINAELQTGAAAASRKNASPTCEG